MCCQCNQTTINRREFLELSAVGMASAGLALPSFSASVDDDWNPDRPLYIRRRILRVQPGLLYELYKKRPMRSWRP